MAIVRSQTFDGVGNLVSEEVVERPVPVVDQATLQQANQTLRSMVQTYAPGGVPTGTVTNVHLRNWLLALTVQARFLRGELDNEV